MNYSNLNASQKQGICVLLIKRPSLLSESPKIAKTDEHSIKLKPNSKPKMQKSYQIPKILKEAVNKQIDDFLALC